MGTGVLGGALREHTLAKPLAWHPAASVIDVGAGLRPCAWYPGAQHLCIEPFNPYAQILKQQGFMVVSCRADEALRVARAETVLLLDVLEHMEREEGERVVPLAKLAASRQVILYTPLGFLAQEGDAWGLGGEEWQRHRSGWMPADFPGWLIEPRGASFFAVWNW